MIGELNKRITIQTPTKASSGMGAGGTVTWTDYATVWAKAWTVSSDEGQQAGKTTLTRIQKFKIRFRRVMLADWRIKFGTKYFNITAIDPDEKSEYMFLTCKEAT